MRRRLAACSRSLWFRIPALVVALLVSVVMGPWMLVAVLAAPLGVADGQWLASGALGAMGVCGLLGLAGLWAGALIPAHVAWKRPALATGVATLLSIGIGAALVGSAWSAAGAVFEVAVGFVLLAALGGVLWFGLWEARPASA